MNDKVKEIIEFIILIIIVLLIKQYIVTPIRVNQSSMNDTLFDKDIMILNKIGIRVSDIKRFDIVVVKVGDTKLIKRVIGLPGEEVEYKDNILYINGKEVKDRYENGYTPNISKVKLGKDQYIILGDNRGNSIDSSELGPIQRKQIIGKTSIVIYPFGRIGGK